MFDVGNYIWRCMFTIHVLPKLSIEMAKSLRLVSTSFHNMIVEEEKDTYMESVSFIQPILGHRSCKKMWTIRLVRNVLSFPKKLHVRFLNTNGNIGHLKTLEMMIQEYPNTKIVKATITISTIDPLYLTSKVEGVLGKEALGHIESVHVQRESQNGCFIQIPNYLLYLHMACFTNLREIEFDCTIPDMSRFPSLRKDQRLHLKINVSFYVYHYVHYTSTFHRSRFYISSLMTHPSPHKVLLTVRDGKCTYFEGYISKLFQHLVRSKYTHDNHMSKPDNAAFVFDTISNILSKIGHSDKERNDFIKSISTYVIGFIGGRIQKVLK